MVRVDYKIEDNNVNTTWVQENGNSHSLMGRLLYPKSDFEVLRRELEDVHQYIYFEEKK